MKVNKKKVILIVFASLISLFFWKPIYIYRIPISAPKLLKAEIKYQMIDFGFDDAARNYLECSAGNVRVYLNDEKTKWLYVSKEDSKMLWGESPFTMRKESYTIIATFRFSKALIGNTPAKVLDTVHVLGCPLISK